MSHRLAGFSSDLIKAHKAEFEAYLAAAIDIPENETQAGKFIEQRENGDVFRYMLVGGHYIPLLEEKERVKPIEFAYKHFRSAWKRFGNFLDHPLNDNLKTWERYLRDSRRSETFAVTEIYQELCRRFEYFRKYYYGIDEVHNLFDLFRQMIPAQDETLQTMQSRPGVTPIKDLSVSKEVNASDVADIILQRQEPYKRGEASENFLILMVASAYMCKSMFHSMFIEGRPTQLTDFQYEVLHQMMIKLADEGKVELFSNHYLDPADFMDTMQEIRSEIQKATALTTDMGSRMISKGLIVQNKAVKRGEVCGCNDKLRDFFLDKIVSRQRLSDLGRNDSFIDLMRRQWRELCMYASRVASFPEGAPQNIEAKARYAEAKTACDDSFRHHMPSNDRAMLHRTLEVMEFMTATEYPLPRSTARICHSYITTRTTLVPLPKQLVRQPEDIGAKTQVIAAQPAKAASAI